MLHTRLPPNGLIIYCGTIITETGKEKKVNYDFEPFKPINTSLYLCDNKFHTEALGELLEQDDKFGFLVMDGNGSLFGTVTGSNQQVLHKFSVELPKKHGRGGQSALRFCRACAWKSDTTICVRLQKLLRNCLYQINTSTQYQRSCSSR